MESDLPKEYSKLAGKDFGDEAVLGKRGADERPTDGDSKPSIKDRIKVREDAKDKRIKVAAVTASAPVDGEVKEESNGKGKKDPSKVRCNFYPSCNKPDCPFVHPKEPCPKFPKCAFGAKCIYIHPSVSVFPASRRTQN